jgi:hypothetical protein
MSNRINLSRLALLLSIALILLAGCGARATPQVESVYVEVAAEAPPAPEPMAREAAGGFDASIPSVDVERLVIKNASSTIVVDDPATSMDAIARMAEEMGGFVVTANLYHNQLEGGLEVPGASITIRVPAEKFDAALGRIRAESDQEPITENINSQDVTADYTDLQSRLRNLEAAEAQLTEIMESATKTEDVLSVYNELVRVREQIEVIKGQIKYYEQSAALSAISVELVANESIRPLTVGGWEPQGVARQAVQALINTLKGLANVVIWLIIYVAPALLALFIVFGLPILLLVLWIRSRRRRRIARQMPPPPATDNP